MSAFIQMKRVMFSLILFPHRNNTDKSNRLKKKEKAEEQKLEETILKVRRKAKVWTERATKMVILLINPLLPFQGKRNSSHTDDLLIFKYSKFPSTNIYAKYINKYDYKEYDF